MSKEPNPFSVIDGGTGVVSPHALQSSNPEAGNVFREAEREAAYQQSQLQVVKQALVLKRQANSHAIGNALRWGVVGVVAGVGCFFLFWALLGKRLGVSRVGNGRNSKTSK